MVRLFTLLNNLVKVYLEKDNLRLVSLNQDYDDILANGTNNIRIIGKVVF